MNDLLKLIAEHKERIERIQNESISLPADVSAAYTTQRPELLKIINRDMNAKEVVAVLDAFAGVMLLNELQKDLLQLQDQFIVLAASMVGDLKAVTRKISNQLT